jgi:glycosyltransferase involved in cell wall biosynthesis
MAPVEGQPHVLIIVENLPVPFDRRVWNEARTLRDAGYDVSVISPTGRGAESLEEKIEGIEVYRHTLPIEAGSMRQYFVEYWAALTSELRLARLVNRGRRVDVVHICNPPDLLFVVALYLKVRAGAKVIFDHHDLTPELFEAKFGRRGFFYWVTRILERLTFAFADISIATNESYREIAMSRGRMRPQRVFTVRSGPDLVRMKPGTGDPAWKNGRKFLVAYVGVMGKQEGIDHLLRAAKHLIGDLARNDIQFCIIGDGSERADLITMADAMGLSDHVTFTGRVSDKIMLDILNASDVCVNPDTANPMNDLSTMNKIMEYMALGKPIVQFDLKEGKVTAQDTSVYARGNDAVDFADKIAELLADPARRAAMGAAGYARVRDQLAWEYERPKLVAAYASLGLMLQKP